jgi:hypothetical protein
MSLFKLHGEAADYNKLCLQVVWWHRSLLQFHGGKVEFDITRIGMLGRSDDFRVVMLLPNSVWGQ